MGFFLILLRTFPSTHFDLFKPCQFRSIYDNSSSQNFLFVDGEYSGLRQFVKSPFFSSERIVTEKLVITDLSQFRHNFTMIQWIIIWWYLKNELNSTSKCCLQKKLRQPKFRIWPKKTTYFISITFCIAVFPPVDKLKKYIPLEW